MSIRCACRAAFLSLALVCAGLMLACGSSGGGEAGLEPTRTLAGTVTVDQFTVGADERVACMGDVQVQCQTATITGLLYAEPATGDGTAGTGITIQSEGDVTVVGRVAAGAGTDGAAEGAGGTGGELTIQSTGGNLTLGSETATRQAADGNPHGVHSGDGGDGGGGHFGGAGGDGGAIQLLCPNGTLTIHPAPGLFQPGSGGQGGDGGFRGEDINNLPEDETITLTNTGGSAQGVYFECAQLVGLATEPTEETYEGLPVTGVVLEPTAWSGGAGGDAGGFYLGVDPQTLEPDHPAPTSRQSADAIDHWSFNHGPLLTEGANGGDGFPASGSGGNVVADLSGSSSPTSGQNGSLTIANGGDAGDISTLGGGLRGFVASGWHQTFGLGEVKPGAGGDATAKASNGANGSPGSNGGNGGKASAKGGEGGLILSLTASFEMAPGFGRGGHAVAEGGAGGRGGDGLGRGEGGDGGAGGEAEGTGGFGAARWGDYQAPGGNATSVTGSGGAGGNSYTRPGHGGAPPLTFAIPGPGNPAGQKIERQGSIGPDGGLLEDIPADEPDTSQRSYDVIYRPVWADDAIRYLEQFITLEGEFWQYELRAAGRQTEALGGPGNPLRANPGQSMVVSRNGRDLWVASEAGDGVRLYKDFQTGGDVPPLAILTGEAGAATFPVQAIHLDWGQTILYAVTGTSTIYAWRNATLVDSDRPADWTIDLTDAEGGCNSLTGDVFGDRLFVLLGSNRIGVLDNASLQRGETPFSRFIDGVANGTSGIAFDTHHQRLYVERTDRTGGNHAVAMVDNAGTASGNVTPTLLQGDATGLSSPGNPDLGWAQAIQVDPQLDALFVQTSQGSLLSFQIASSLAGNVAPTGVTDSRNSVAMAVYPTP